MTCVEAQETSYRLLIENILGNGLNECVQAIHGDIRDLDLGERFPLITGSPPYFPIGKDRCRRIHKKRTRDSNSEAMSAITHGLPNGTLQRMVCLCFVFRFNRKAGASSW